MIDLSSLPKFIDATDGSMWRVPENWDRPADRPVLYVRLADVEERLEGFELVRIPSRRVQDML